MNDPHVVSLTYNLIPASSIQFNDPPALEIEYDAFRLRLANQILTVSMKEHHATEESACVCVQPCLTAWEIASGLQQGRSMMSFQFAKSEITDRNPTPGQVSLVGCSMVAQAGQLTCTFGFGTYPAPPSDFSASNDVKIMWSRYRAYREGHEPLLSMAYACLSLLEGTTGTKTGARNAVCAKYNIEQVVRNKLGDLVSEKGSPEEARKLDHEATKTPLTGGEKAWIECVIRVLIRRKAEYDFDPCGTFTTIKLTDFPAI